MKQAHRQADVHSTQARFFTTVVPPLSGAVHPLSVSHLRDTPPVDLRPDWCCPNIPLQVQINPPCMPHRDDLFPSTPHSLRLHNSAVNNESSRTMHAALLLRAVESKETDLGPQTNASGWGDDYFVCFP